MASFHKEQRQQSSSNFYIHFLPRLPAAPHIYQLPPTFTSCPHIYLICTTSLVDFPLHCNLIDLFDFLLRYSSSAYTTNLSNYPPTINFLSSFFSSSLLGYTFFHLFLPYLHLYCFFHDNLIPPPTFTSCFPHTYLICFTCRFPVDCNVGTYSLVQIDQILNLPLHQVFTNLIYHFSRVCTFISTF